MYIREDVARIDDLHFSFMVLAPTARATLAD